MIIIIQYTEILYMMALLFLTDLAVCASEQNHSFAFVTIH